MRWVIVGCVMVIILGFACSLNRLNSLTSKYFMNMFIKEPIMDINVILAFLAVFSISVSTFTIKLKVPSLFMKNNSSET